MIRRGCYILTNALTDLEETVLDWSEREAAQMGITLAILGLIFMSNGKVGNSPREPPLLVQRCNGTTAGLGYLEVNVICSCKSTHWAVD